MKQTRHLSVLCIFLSFFLSNPIAFAESDAKSPDLGSGQLVGCTDGGCPYEIFRSDGTQEVCVRFDANGGQATLKVVKGNIELPIIESGELDARTVCLHASSITLICQSPTGSEGQCFYRIVQIK